MTESQEFSISNLQSYRSEAFNDQVVSKPKNIAPLDRPKTVVKEQGLLEVHRALIELYLDVKVRSNEEIVTLNEDKLEKEQARLMETETLALVEYIKTSIEILLNLKMDSSAHTKQSFRQNRVDTEGTTSQLDNSHVTSSSNFTSVNGQPPKAYEEMIQKLESDVRSHIRIEQQIKIAMEGLQQKVEDKDREKKQLKSEYKQYINELK